MTRAAINRGFKRISGAKPVPPKHRKKKGVSTSQKRTSGFRPGSAVTVFDYNQPGDSVGTRYGSFLEAVQIVTSGLPVEAVSRLQQTSGLTLERIKQLAQISEGSFARRKQTGRLSQEESERLLRVSRVFELATALNDGDQVEARQWLETPIPALGNQRPLDLTQTEPGAREVEDLIGRIEHGVVS
jgi:putative toxin-antitoxin system antitoxin component (TIGR02293 family)